MQFQSCRRALEDGLRQWFPKVKVEEFGVDTANPGIKVDLQTTKGMANVQLWGNLSFDVDAIENVTGRVLLRRSTEDVTPTEVASTIAKLVSILR